MPTKMQPVLRYDEALANISYCKSNIEILADKISDRTDGIQGEVDTLINRVNSIQCQIDELFALLGPVLDAMTEKPKQKWLWEIFEPNDIQIDFPYNL